MHIQREYNNYRGEFKESLGINFFSPFQPEREFKVYKSCINVYKLNAVEYINTVCSLDYSFQFRNFYLMFIKKTVRLLQQKTIYKLKISM